MDLKPKNMHLYSSANLIMHCPLLVEKCNCTHGHSAVSLQVRRGPRGLLQGGEEGGALCDHLQEDQPEEGPGNAYGVGNWPNGAHPGHAPERL